MVKRGREKWSMKEARTFPEDCPLVKIPEKMDVVSDDESIWAERRRGYNACIDEILKER